ncbi:MDR family MFS transporter [Sinanaerobacter chloroacetimidivorans]|uniref:MFS transporter n=1 Tax=Sinanaerobacter chloroacetimidivorans TaxID=2818044 RepID=A0A8J7W528_9FIRM|nr:MDR family MFS transporter [Sinanaerobacter chloroacetimidivorans]MBR0599340.1 MFS transporter [Sinanaerobacter chloroacetimidivorans]
MEHLTYQRKVTIMAAIIASMFFSSINQTIVGVALPRIIAKLGGMEYYTWVITIYLLTSTISTILVGKLSDIYGRKYFILSGIVIFMAGAFLAGTSTDIIQLIVYRGIQGTGAGIIMATAFTAIGDLFSPRERGRWSGLMSAIFGMSSILGPGLGGYIVDHFEWHWVFWLFLPLGILAFFMILFLFPKVERQESQSIDYPGSLLLTLTIVPMLLAFSWAGTKYPWSSTMIIGLFAFTLTALVLFIFTERKVKTPVLPLDIFKNSVVTISNVIGFIMNAGMMGALMYMPFYVQGVMGISPTYAGYVTMPMSISMLAMSAYTGRRMTKTGKYKNLALTGMAIMVFGMFLMIIMKNIPVAVLSMIIFGSGLGLGMPVFMLAVQNVVDSKDLGVATASVQLFRNLGGTIGIAVMGTVLSTSIANKMNGLISASAGLNSSGLDSETTKQLTRLMDPQLLLDQSKLSVIQNGLPEQAQPVFAQLLEGLRQALATSLSNVFLTGTIVLVVALVLTFLLKEMPLRTTVHKVSEPRIENQRNLLRIENEYDELTSS